MSAAPAKDQVAFAHEPMTDFADASKRAEFKGALDGVREKFGRHYPLIINVEERLESTFPSLNPARPSEVIGRLSQATLEHAWRAVEAAEAAFPSWRNTPAQERARIMLRAADLLRARRHEISAWNVFETGRPWHEADGETAETVDFFGYYARQLLEREAAQDARLEPTPGEKSSFRYVPLGVGIVLTPWNFPTAQLAGITSAALLAGNTVVVKPASAGAVTGYHLIQLFLEAGVPPGVLNFLTGKGDALGQALVEHPRTRFVALTGRRETGKSVFEKAARLQEGQTWFKRCILELGGKNAVVVDETADLNAAAEGIVASAFSYQGQKCSAGSRAILVEAVHDEVLERVKALTEALVVGDPAEPNTYVGPVIDSQARDKILEYIEIGKREADLVLGGGVVEGAEGYFIEPTIFANASKDARIAQEEIIGPVLTVLKARNFGDAVNIANATSYGLTGSFYSQNQERIARAGDLFQVGNLYINRKCVGSEVGRHPFGGFNMSGTDSKAGGPDYLLQFSQGQTISEGVGGGG